MNTIFKSGAFVDYQGKEHKFVVAGLVASFKDDELSLERYIESNFVYDDLGDVVYDDDDEPIIVDDTEAIAPIYKVISIGISICNPTDEFIEWKGRKQAEGRANKYHDRVIAFSKGGMCTDDTVEFFVNQTVDNLTKFPGLFIKGYNEAERKYKKFLTIGGISQN